jgi:hypothetical protein
MVFLANIYHLGIFPEREMKESQLFEKLPEHLTYPNVTPKLIEEADKWWEYRKDSQ